MVLKQLPKYDRLRKISESKTPPTAK